MGFDGRAIRVALEAELVAAVEAGLTAAGGRLSFLFWRGGVGCWVFWGVIEAGLFLSFSFACVCVCVCVCGSSPVFGWGEQGHLVYFADSNPKKSIPEMKEVAN